MFFKDSKQYLGLGKNQSQDFDAQISATTLTMIQYDILSVVEGFSDYESGGELFRGSKAETIQSTVTDRIWKLIVEILTQIAEILEIETELLMKKNNIGKSDNYKIDEFQFPIASSYRVCEN